MYNDTPRQSQRHIKADFAASDKWSRERREDDKQDRRSRAKKMLAAVAATAALLPAGLFVANKIVDQEIKRQDETNQQNAPLSHSIDQNKDRPSTDRPLSNNR